MFGWGNEEQNAQFNKLATSEAKKANAPKLRQFLSSFGIIQGVNSLEEYIAEGALISLYNIRKSADTSKSVEIGEYIDGISILTFTNYLSYILEGKFEISGGLALIRYFDFDETKTAQAVADYNKANQTGPKIVTAIGESFAQWSLRQSDDDYQKIVELFKLLSQRDFKP